jgi:predicted Fe-S protein YdhL (DUF1289 family)
MVNGSMWASMTRTERHEISKTLKEKVEVVQAKINDFDGAAPPRARALTRARAARRQCVHSR